VGPRTGLSTTLLAGAAVLLIAIAIGNAFGNRIVGQVTGPTSVLAPTPLPVVRDAPRDRAEAPAGKEDQVMSVATDPGFPDPRVTPEPQTPGPTPAPTAALTASPVPAPKAVRSQPYTSPPLLFPLATPTPFSDEQAQTTDSQGSPAARGRGTPANPAYGSPESPSGARP
jgi:hypothetical protein